MSNKIYSKKLENILISKLNMSNNFAKNIIKRLEKCLNQTYFDAVLKYATSEQMTLLTLNGYDTNFLMDEYGMDYVNAVLMLVWIEESSEEAISALDAGIDFIA